MEFIKIVLKFIYRPKKTIQKMILMENTHKYGWYLIFLFSVLYTFTVKKFDLLGLVPITDKFLIFPAINYYYYETFIVIPVTLCAVYINFMINKSVAKGQHNKNLWGIISFATLIPALTILWFYETFFIFVLNINHFTLDIIRIGIWILWTIYLTNLSMYFFSKNRYNRVMATAAAIITLLFIVLFFR